MDTCTYVYIRTDTVKKQRAIQSHPQKFKILHCVNQKQGKSLTHPELRHNNAEYLHDQATQASFISSIRQLTWQPWQIKSNSINRGNRWHFKLCLNTEH